VAVSHYRFLNAGGEASREIMDFDWASTSLGPIEEWPPVLKTTLALMLRSTFPKALVWGPEFITFHNDAFRPILGEKPPAIGRSFSEVWAEAWDKIEPIALDALAGRSTFIENFSLVVERDGAPEQAYFTFCYSPVLDSDGTIMGFMDTVVETTEAVQAQRQADVLNAELGHRIRNILALVGSIASQTLRSSTGLAEAETSLNHRLRALASVQDALRTGGTADAEVHAIVATALSPHALGDGRVTAEGPNVRLPEEKALALSLALNELVTNAIKYGALSNEEGSVDISWGVEGPEGQDFRLLWRERGGPRVTAPLKAGFGSRLIQRHVAEAFGGKAQITFGAEGVTYEIGPETEKPDQ
jgi:two-component sensor histidine kinase